MWGLPLAATQLLDYTHSNVIVAFMLPRYARTALGLRNIGNGGFWPA
jgi:hypothetical protein